MTETTGIKEAIGLLKATIYRKYADKKLLHERYVDLISYLDGIRKELE